MNVGCMVFGAFVALSLPVAAQTTGPINVVGKVGSIDASAITLTADDGATERFRLAPNLLVVAAKPATLADIRPDDFIASAAARRADGKLHSTELRIFPAAMRGVGEGQRAMNDAQNQTMTNATVTGTAVAEGSNTIKVRFEGGESELILDPGVPVTRLEVADKALVRSGVAVRLQGMRDADGGSVSRITIL